MRSSFPCARWSLRSMARPLTEYVGSPAAFVYTPSDAPVDMVGITGNPGHIWATTFSSGWNTSGRSGGGGYDCVDNACSVTPPMAPTYITEILGSDRISTNFRRMSSDECPGAMRQFTLAFAICGRALLACPASSRVATQVVRSFE